MLILALLGSSLTLAIALLALLYVAAKTDRQATFVETGGMKFVTKGETLLSVLDNIPGFFIDQTTHKLVEDTPANRRDGNPRKKGWLQKHFGIFWVSIFYPVIKIHDFNIVADKLREEIEGQRNLPLRERIQSEIRDAEGYLRFRFAHPILIPGIELGKDRWKVDIILVVDIRIVNPVIVVFDYKGTVMRQVDAAITSATLDYWNNIPMKNPDGTVVTNPDGTIKTIEFGYPEFVASDKGPTSHFATKIMELNSSTSPAAVNDGLTTRFGIEIMAAWIEMADLSPEQQTLDNAARAKEEKKLLADSRIEQARGERTFERETRLGTAEGFKAMIEALVASGVDPNTAAALVTAHAKTSNLAGAPTLQTYVESGAVTLSKPSL